MTVIAGEVSEQNKAALIDLLHQAHLGESIGVALFGDLVAVFPEHEDDLRAAESVERAMLALLVRMMRREGVSPAHDAEVTAHREADAYVDRFRSASWAAVADDLLVWSAQAAAQFSALVTGYRDDADQLADARAFVAHEAALVDWARLTATGDDRAAPVLHAYLASLEPEPLR